MIYHRDIVCPTHSIMNQSFSVLEIEWILKNSKQLRLCSPCRIKFKRILIIKQMESMIFPYFNEVKDNV